MEQSILRSVKKTLGIEPDDTSFDLDVITHINSVMTDLNQLGVGPDEGFMIEDDSAVWADFLGLGNRFNNVKTYMFFRLRLIWDPPKTSFEINAVNDQKKELEWRINVEFERTNWHDPDPHLEDVLILDGGSP